MMRVLQCVNDMQRAGLETVLMNYYRHIDRGEIQFDFLTHRPYKGDYDDEITALGGRLYYAPRLYPQNYGKYFKWMGDFFAAHPEYRIVHSHIDAMSYLPLRAAKLAGVPVRIAHSHNTSIDRDYKWLLKRYFRRQIPRAATFYCACGQEAGRFLFPGREFTVIPNAIEADRFLFREEVRARKRAELGCGDAFVVGHVGRLSSQKNHEFLLKIFREIHGQAPDSLLLLAGSGEKEQTLKAQARALGIEGVVRFLGSRTDTDELYQAMDVFVMPSLFEGIPLVGVEAQFAGLPCFFSTGVPAEVGFGEDVKFIGLEQSPAAWA